jgi:hypothetical protein
MELDELYGPCRPAGAAIHEAELRLQPLSLTTLSEKTAHILHELLAFRDRNKLGRSAVQAMPILWIVLRDGGTRFAVEEVWDVQTGQFIHSLPKGRLGLPDGRAKLGHPALLDDDKAARMGGEILFDTGVATWVITNSSGRYGRREWQTPAHLEAVAGIFRNLGIYLEPVFDD